MVRKSIAALFAAALLPASAFAADHVDSPAATGDPSADIADLYAWTSDDASMINLVMTVTPFATEESLFSDAVTYAFHVNSSAAYGEAQTETLITCQFYDVDAIECWAGDAYVTGDPSSETGIGDGELRVFAGLRNDPFFFELAGFNATVDIVKSVAGDLVFTDGCPAVDEATSAVLVGQLQSGPEGVPATDTLAGANVLALVVQIDADLVNAGGPLLGVWASTHRGE